ncbi:VOC family protein [soil metagenome]
MTDVPVRGVDHVAILVRNVDEALPYYQNVLKLTVIHDEMSQSAGVRLVYLDAGNVLIQLVCPFAPGPLSDALEANGEGLHHVCFQVEDIPSSLPQLTDSQGVSVSVGGRNRRTAFLPDRPNGLIMELTEIEETAT